ncbi:AarF/ABC1/UbiB kinase family protein, partial [Candidatus Woesearchaeota archaeon]|nr:AarF/ABC1/UbiB kinase family protein [Candidatus Woesearchaeota archaeon]
SEIPVRLRRVMENAGGAFVKVGQMLSLRSDLIPQEYCDEFAKLQDNVKPFPYIEVKKILETEFKRPLKDVFKDFEEKPIASASIGQVHKARLKSGQLVAVKVQRPDIKKTFDADINLLEYIAEEAEKYLSEVRVFKPQKIVEEFKKYTEKELDFLSEAKNIEKFHEHYKYSPHIKIPKVYWEYCTTKVIVMEFIDGEKVSNVEHLTREEKKKIALTVYNSFIEQVFDMGTFHADPHPGNIFLLKNGKIALLDFGIVGHLSPDLKENVEFMLVGLVKGDLDILLTSFVNLGMVDGVDEEKLKEDLFEAWGEFHGSSLKQINMKRFFNSTFELGRKYNIDFPHNFVLLVKAVITTEGFAKQLYPEASFIEICAPKVEHLIKEEHDPKKLFHSFKKGAFEFTTSLRKFPQDLRSLIHILKTGSKVKVEIDHKELNDLTVELDHSSNRITFGLIIGGLIITTGLLIVADLGPKYFGLPISAWISLMVIVLLSLVLGVSILTEKRRGEQE